MKLKHIKRKEQSAVKKFEKAMKCHKEKAETAEPCKWFSDLKGGVAKTFEKEADKLMRSAIDDRVELGLLKEPVEPRERIHQLKYGK